MVLASVPVNGPFGVFQGEVGVVCWKSELAWGGGIHAVDGVRSVPDESVFRELQFSELRERGEEGDCANNDVKEQ